MSPGRRLQRGLALLLLALPLAVPAQDFGFDPPPDANSVLAPSIMRDLAERIVPVYQEPDTDRYLTNMAALQLVTANYEAAYDTAQTLRERHQDGGDPGRTVDRAVIYEIYAHARAIEAIEKIPFAVAFARSFRDVVPPLDNRDADAVVARLLQPLKGYGDAVQQGFDRWRGAETIPLPDALDLVRKYLAFEAHRSFAPLVPALAEEEDRRRFLPPEAVQIKLAGAQRIDAVVVRPSSKKPLPALLRLTSDPSEDDARLTAAHGYAGVVAYVRGRRRDGSGRVTPFEHEAADARAVINWIARQSWCDGRVGLYGEGYSGYAAWAAAGHAPPALKAIATAAPMMPGVDFPMQAQIYRNRALRWIAEQTLPATGPKPPNEDQKWTALDQIWYASGRPYRDLDRLFLGRRNALFQTWLTHPSDDRYWQKRRPGSRQLAHVTIPALTLGGYFGADAGALELFEAHRRADPKADHTLLLGPYDGETIRSGRSPTVRGYSVAASAQIDLRELRYQWFDSVFKKAPRPALLADRVNLQLTGTDEWRHAASLAALAGKPQRFFLDPASKDAPALLPARAAGEDYREQRVDLRDRSDAQRPLSEALVVRAPALEPGDLVFTSAPLAQPLEVGGALGGLLDFTPNRQDVDLHFVVYERLANGDQMQLGTRRDLRASYAAGAGTRRLLRAGERQQLRFTLDGLIQRRLQAGSRLVLVLGINRRADRQINYGSGQAVNQESIADAGPPLRIRWYGGSYLELPVRR